MGFSLASGKHTCGLTLTFEGNYFSWEEPSYRHSGCGLFSQNWRIHLPWCYIHLESRFLPHQKHDMLPTLGNVDGKAYNSSTFFLQSPCTLQSPEVCWSLVLSLITIFATCMLSSFTQDSNRSRRESFKLSPNLQYSVIAPSLATNIVFYSPGSLINARMKLVSLQILVFRSPNFKYFLLSSKVQMVSPLVDICYNRQISKNILADIRLFIKS